MDQEQAYLEALGAVERFELRNGSLVLLTGSGELLVYSQTSP
jgi:heat shock protein HslJ